MPNPLPRMTFAERSARQEAKRHILLRFLASGEVFTSTELAARVMGVSRPVAVSTLKGLERDGALKSETHLYFRWRLQIWGITPHGLALAEVFASAPFFEMGRLNPNYLPHHLETQAARLAAENAGWKSWVPGRALFNQGLKKVPDAQAINPEGLSVAVEIERHIKTPKRYADIISAYLQEISKGRWVEVHYLTPTGLDAKLLKAFQAIQTVPVQGEKVALKENHRARFKFFPLNQWPSAERS